MDQKTKNIFNNLLAQINKISKHARQGSYKTRVRYKAAVIRLISFLASEFRLVNWVNFQSKHLFAYVNFLKESGKSPATIKTDISAIKYYYDQTPGAKYILCDNNALEIDRRTFGGVDRTWSDEEFYEMVKIAQSLNQERVVNAFYLGRFQGLRIHEALRIDRAAAERALKTELLHIKGKNGLERDVPLSPEIREVFSRMLQNIPRGEKLFIQPTEKTHLVIKQIQNFIVRHRKKVERENRESRMTYHGLRHSWSALQYKIRIESGMSEHKARREVSELLGHGRDDVTRIYLASIYPREDEK